MPNKSLQHEDLRIGKRRYTSTHSYPRHVIEMTGQFHASSTLPLGKEPSMSIILDPGLAPEQDLILGRKQKCLLLPEIELRFSSPLHSHYTSIDCVIGIAISTIWM